jgi:hypothetical protein
VDIPTFQALLTPSGQEILQAATALSPRETDFLIHFQSLCRRYPPDLARAALEIAILRLKAAAKFPFADKLYFTRQALEQSSSLEISTYRAERFRQFQFIADLGCSVGGDTFSLVKIAPTLGMDRDRLRLSMAYANLNTLGLLANSQLLQTDLVNPLPIKSASTALFFDPARRSGDHRFFSVRQYQPPLAIIRDWLPDFPALAVKISPGVDLSELDGYEAEIEFISMDGELKEAVLWFGPMKSASRRATILPGLYQLSFATEDHASIAPIQISDPLAFLYEPDPAVIRSGLVSILAEMIDASHMDADIAYLTSNKHSPTPFSRVWRIEDWFPFNLKRLRAYLRLHHIGHLTVKKRGSPIEPGFLIHQLRVKGDQECVLVLTHLRGEPIVLICKGV